MPRVGDADPLAVNSVQQSRVFSTQSIFGPLGITARAIIESASEPLFHAETHPAENVWEYLRKNKLPIRIYETYDTIVEACCEAWNDLMETPDRIVSCYPSLGGSVITYDDWHYTYSFVWRVVCSMMQFRLGGAVLNLRIPDCDSGIAADLDHAFGRVAW